MKLKQNYMVLVLAPPNLPVEEKRPSTLVDQCKVSRSLDGIDHT